MKSTRALMGEGEVSAYLEELRKKHEYKYFLLGVVGIMTGFRVSDLLKLVYGDFKAARSFLVVKEQKTGKTRQIAIQEELRAYVLDAKKMFGKRDKDYLFPGRYPDRPMDRTTAWRHLSEAAKVCGYPGIAVHGLRKTYAIRAYREFDGDLEKVRELMNHKYSDTTLYHYILANINLAELIKSELMG